MWKLQFVFYLPNWEKILRNSIKWIAFHLDEITFRFLLWYFVIIVLVVFFFLTFKLKVTSNNIV